VAVALAAVNTFGGFLVTERMLEMFKKKDRGQGARGKGTGARGQGAEGQAQGGRG
jgi:NAD(P) transhydrogenase subunit alpha